MIREFQFGEVLVELEENPFDNSQSPNDIIEAKVISVGKECEKYRDWVGKTVLVKRESARELKLPYFTKNERVVANEKYILCKYQK